MKKQVLLFTESLLNSYAILFFSQNSILAVLLLVASFFNPAAGLAGLLSASFTLLMVRVLGFAKDHIQKGIYSFNSLLLGIGLGTFYHINTAFWIWLTAACICCMVVSVTLTHSLNQSGLPALSLPFILIFWVILLAANGYSEMGLLPKESYILNELAVKPYHSSQLLFSSVDGFALPYYLRLFFRALSALLFQDSVAAGIVISLGLLIHSRISFCLVIIGFVVACLFNNLLHIYPEGLGHYHLGVNFMTTCMAIGSFFLIPSWRSYLFAIISIPVAYILIGAFTRWLEPYHLPVLSLPFCLLVNISLYFLKLRVRPGKLQLTLFQHYSPETNLYLSISGQERLTDLNYLKISLPFMGTWMVSQGYNGNITHQQEWGQALDFVITDEDGRTCREPGTLPEHFYCFNKPVLACADGIVETVVNHVDDNPIGQVNTNQNWGNTIIIKHAEGLYSKVAHLKNYSARVKQGDYVKQGELIALCGNSGRSPQPHLHFQMQASPYTGSKTLSYPFGYFKSEKQGKPALFAFTIPTQGMQVDTPELSPAIKQAFALQPGYAARIVAEHTAETWEVYTDTLNQTYIYSFETKATAYFINNGSAFYFTNFYGNHSSLLYQFYLAAYKVLFTAETGIKATDTYSLSLEGNRLRFWLHDAVSPFYRFIRRTYSSTATQSHQLLRIDAEGYRTGWGGRAQQFMKAGIHINNGSIISFDVTVNGIQTKALWQAVNTY